MCIAYNLVKWLGETANGLLLFVTKWKMPSFLELNLNEN